MVIFVGDKPSSKNTDPNIAFVGTKSYYVLAKWIHYLGVENYKVINRVDYDFQDVIKEAYFNKYPVVVLGKVAEKAVVDFIVENCLFNTAIHSLPHPSGRNRKLNDKDYVVEELEKCRQFLINYSVESTEEYYI